MSEPKHTSQPSLIERSVENVSTVLAVWHPAYRNRPIHADVVDALVPAVLLLLVQAMDYRVLQPNAALNIQVLQSTAGGTALALLALICVMALLRFGTTVWQMAIGVLWALIFGTIASTFLLSTSEPTGLLDWMLRRFGVVYLFALVFLVLRLNWRGVLAFAGLISPAMLATLPWFMTLGAPAPEQEASFFNPDVEMIYAAQSGLLSEQTDALRPSILGTPELFAVLGAGYPFEGVFRREVAAVKVILEERYKAQNRIISLVNDDEDVSSFPLMNRVNFAVSLKTLSEVMDPEDIALIFLTSHGAPDVLATSFNEVITRDITASDIEAALKASGIENIILILPACYSGSFADTLGAPNRLILTGADADSVSFGCNDQNEWTEWGRAFFVEALARTRDFREAASLAKESVARREKNEGRPPSSPQIVEGAAIGRILDAWLSEID